jgi:hypothetical protein
LGNHWAGAVSFSASFPVPRLFPQVAGFHFVPLGHLGPSEYAKVGAAENRGGSSVVRQGKG